MKVNIKKILLTEDQIQNRVKELGEKITNDYKDKKLLMISILKGSVIFMSDLMRTLNIKLRIDFISVSSYSGGTKSTGVVKILKDLDMDIEGYDVLIVEDILDSGLTLNYLKNLLLQRKPKNIKIVTLLDKVEKRDIDIEADYVGFKIPDEFVVGYGLDYREEYRNLPYIGILNFE